MPKVVQMWLAHAAVHARFSPNMLLPAHASMSTTGRAMQIGSSFTHNGPSIYAVSSAQESSAACSCAQSFDAKVNPCEARSDGAFGCCCATFSKDLFSSSDPPSRNAPTTLPSLTKYVPNFFCDVSPKKMVSSASLLPYNCSSTTKA